MSLMADDSYSGNGSTLWNILRSHSISPKQKKSQGHTDHMHELKMSLLILGH